MKTYKRTRIIASLAILSSLTLTGVTFAANDTRPTMPYHAMSRSIGIRDHRTATSSESTRTRKNKRLDQHTATTSPAIMGTVSTVSGSSFTITRPPFIGRTHGAIASTSPIITTNATTTYTVNTTDGTVYLKNGKLDSATDVIPGAFVRVTGTLDTTTNSITALGVNIVDRPNKSMKHALGTMKK